MPKRPARKTLNEVRQPAKVKSAPNLFLPELPPPPPARAFNSDRPDKYFYLWVVALIAFGIGLLTGYGIAFKRYTPELIDQYLRASDASVRLESIKSAGEKIRLLVPPPPPNDEGLAPAPPLTAEDELAKADAWLKAQNLNSYGDPPDTVYAGGTPLFDESSGESIDRYEYLRAKFPNPPWLQN